ncbi:MAG: hypothetical protein H7319_11525 [Spirosoma sp.]|nr:hypothetical protein [Spirosoma sp.]
MKILYSLLFCLLPAFAWANGPVDEGTVEKRKTITKLFDVDANDALTVDNQFGQVSIGLWDRNEIRIQITVTANSSSDERVQRFLDAVTIDEKRSGNQIVVRTNFSQSTTGNWNVSSWKSNGERNFVRIDYAVMMPKQNTLTVRNKFGNTSIPAFHAPLSVYSRYGNFDANELTSQQTDIDVAYGKAMINALSTAKLDMAYGSLDLNQVNVLTLVNKFGKMHIGDVGKLTADIDYSGSSSIGTLRESGQIKLSFSGGFRIEQLPATANTVAIQASYSSVVLPADNGSDFDVTVSYGNFTYGNGSSMRFTMQPSDSDGHRGPRLTKQYIGTVGRGTGPKIRVISKFGNVQFK